MKLKAQTDKNRKLNLNWDLIDIYLSRWKPDTWFDIEITRHQHKKSDPMRKLFFGGILPTLMEHLGYEPDEKLFFHWQLKVKFFGIQPDKKGIYHGVPSVFGNKSEIPISKKKDYLEWVVRKAAKMGCYIPMPGEE